MIFFLHPDPNPIRHMLDIINGSTMSQTGPVDTNLIEIFDVPDEYHLVGVEYEDSLVGFIDY